MEALSSRFIKGSGEFLAQTYSEKALFYLETNAEFALKKREEELAKLKSEVQILIDNCQSVASTCLSDPGIWWHLEQHPGLCYDQNSDILERPVRFAIGRLAPILLQYEIIDMGYAARFRFEYDPKGCLLPYYTGPLQLPGTLKDTIRQYAKLHAKALKMTEKLGRLATEAKKTQVDISWSGIQPSKVSR